MYIVYNICIGNREIGGGGMVNIKIYKIVYIFYRFVKMFGFCFLKV